MVEVDEFDERLDLGSLGESLFAHSLGNGERISLNASDKSMRELLSSLSFIVVLNNYSFLSSKSSVEDEADSSLLHTKRTVRRTIACDVREERPTYNLPIFVNNNNDD